jgi:hypothetical protein
MAVNPTYDTRKVTHGIHAFAKFDLDYDASTGALVTTTVPTIETGASEAQLTTSADSTSIYADDTVQFQGEGVQSRTGTFTFYQYTQELMENLAGFYLESNGGLSAHGTKKNMGCQWLEKDSDANGNVIDVLHILYNVQGTGQPQVQSQTDNNNLTTRTYAFTFNSLPNPKVLNGAGVPEDHFTIRGDTAAKQALIALAYTKIILPTDATPSSTQQA